MSSIYQEDERLLRIQRFPYKRHPLTETYSSKLRLLTFLLNFSIESLTLVSAAYVSSFIRCIMLLSPNKCVKVVSSHGGRLNDASSAICAMTASRGGIKGMMSSVVPFSVGRGL